MPPAKPEALRDVSTSLPFPPWSQMNWSGLAATTWDDFAGDEPRWDYYAYRRLIEQHPGKVLDVGCGTGRLLIPYLAAGIDIEGVDSSEEMLSICRENAAGKGLTATLYEQHMQTLDLTNRYSTIIVPGGSFHLIIDREESTEALRRCNEHLDANGVLALDLDDPTEELSEDTLGRWIRRGMVTGPDGTEVHQERMKERIDRAEQVTSTLIRYRVVRDDKVVQEQVNTMMMRLYFRHEIQRMLEAAGFREIAAIDADSGTSGPAESRWLPLLVATK